MLVAAAVAVGVFALSGPERGDRARPAGHASEIAAETATGPATTPDGIGAAFRDPETASAAMLAARTAVTAVDSYDYRTLAADIDAGTRATTGAFRGSYRAAMLGAVTATAHRDHTVQACTVQKAGLLSLTADGTRADVLVLALLRTTDTASPQGRAAPVALDVTMLQENGDWLVAGMAGVDQSPVPVDGSAGVNGLDAAVAEGQSAIVDLLTYRRDHFDADFGRALDVLDANGRQQQEPQRAAIEAQLERKRIDLGGELDALAVEDAGYGSVTLLAAVDHYQVDAAGNRTALGELRLEVGLVQSGGRWLVDSFVTLPSA